MTRCEAAGAVLAGSCALGEGAGGRAAPGAPGSRQDGIAGASGGLLLGSPLLSREPAHQGCGTWGEPPLGAFSLPGKFIMKSY